MSQKKDNAKELDWREDLAVARMGCSRANQIRR
jgi:hypothetical protein